MVAFMAGADASGLDLHWLWHNHCADCHGHAGEFSRKFLKVSDGELQGAHHVHDLRQFLSNHHLAGNEVDAVYNMLLAQANTQARFKDECSSCHDSAAEFIRAELVLRDGVLVSRISGRPVGEFLIGHQDLEPDDADFYLGVLHRVAHEIYRP
jgi:hypothetical protein